MARYAKPARTLKAGERWRLFAGVGGIGAGIFFALDGGHTLGRNESRPGRLLDVRDYCKLHIIAHYFSILTGADRSGRPVRVLPIGKVGDDEAARALIEEMREAGMDTRFVSVAPGKPTLFSVCFQYPDGSGGNITTSDAAAAALRAADVDAVEGLLAESAGRFVVLAAPEAPLAARKRLLQLAKRHGGFTAASFTSAEIPEALSSGMPPLVDLLAVNEDEAGAIAGEEFDPAQPERLLDRCADAVTRLNASARIILSVGKSGAYGFEAGRWRFSPSASVEVASTAGAGDALLGGTLAGLAAGLPLTADGPRRKAITAAPLDSALDLGVLLAAFSVTSPHTIHPGANLESLISFAGSLGVSFSDEIKGKFS